VKTRFQQAIPSHDPCQEQKIEIGIAVTEREKQEIFRLRYRIYVEEMGRQPVAADHSRKLLADEIDRWAFLLYAKSGSELIATMRVNVGLIEEFPRDLARLLCMDKFRRFCAESGFPLVAFSSKLMVSPAYRNSPALHLLTAKGYELYCDHQVQFNFGGCNFYLLRLYEQFGCRRFGRNFVDPGFGLLAPFVLLVNDIAHLKAVHSPFTRIARKKAVPNSDVKDWFYREFPEAASVMNSQLTTGEELWRFLCNRLGGSPEERIPVIKGLTREEAKDFLHSCGVSARCYPGDHVITRDMVSDELNILVSGTLLSAAPNAGPPNIILPGEHFGANGLLDKAVHTLDIIAAATTEILVFSRQYFAKFRRTKPEVAFKILRNLAPDRNMSGLPGCDTREGRVALFPDK